MRADGPKLMADALSRLDPSLRKQLEESLGRTTAAMAAGGGGDAILKLMEARRARGAGPASSEGARAILSLDKDWHGVHYVLCGEVEPGAALLSQPVMGGSSSGMMTRVSWVMDGVRRLRDFYSDAAGMRRAIVTCLV